LLLSDAGWYWLVLVVPIDDCYRCIFLTASPVVATDELYIGAVRLAMSHFPAGLLLRPVCQACRRY